MDKAVHVCGRTFTPALLLPLAEIIAADPKIRRGDLAREVCVHKVIQPIEVLLPPCRAFLHPPITDTTNRCLRFLPTAQFFRHLCDFALSDFGLSCGDAS
jgi:hypothetical protein